LKTERSETRCDWRRAALGLPGDAEERARTTVPRLLMSADESRSQLLQVRVLMK
jgi:hypothetical protein